ncbi:MAG: DNA polymerase III subunit beta [Acidobacteria bacterium]|nr:MAG: DNA polymerase III subunit beta [Acidobacteriota bacterium]
MELVARKNDLLKELSLLQGIVERKNTIPILANVLIQADKSGVSLLATDLDVGLRSKCEATVTKTGTLTLPAKKLFEIVSALPDTDIRIEEDKSGKSVTIAADRFESKMQTLPASEFPTPPQDAAQVEASLPGAALKRLISHTRFAITSEDTRYFLNGAQLVLKSNEMSMIATDGHRLALVTVKESAGKGAKSEVLLPRKTLNEVGRLIDDAGVVEFSQGENHLFFKTEGRLLISRKIDANFPAYERVIPKSNDKSIEFDRDRLAAAVKRVRLLSNERSKAVRFVMGKDQVEITSSTPEVGEAHEVLPVDYSGGAMQICFNADYVDNFLSVVETESVLLEFKDEMSQAVMKPIGADGYEYTYVIMPMRI